MSFYVLFPLCSRSSIWKQMTFQGSTSFPRARTEGRRGHLSTSLIREAEDVEDVEHVEQATFSVTYVFYVF